MALFACKVGGAEGKDGVIKIGTYNTTTDIDVSSYNASSVDEFLCTVDSGAQPTGTSFYWQQRTYPDYSDYQSYGASMSAPTLSLNGNTLTVTPAIVHATASGTESYDHTANASCSVYYVGNVQ